MSGSQKRQRGRAVMVALTDDEHAKVQADAEALGLSLSGYGRTLFLGAVTPGTQTRAPRDAVELARLSGQLGKVGANLNQLTKLGNQGQLVPPSVLAACLAEVRGTIAEIAEAINHDY